MSEDVICIKETSYGDFFDAAPSGSIFLLNDNLAAGVWDNEIHQGSSSYFQLPNDNWIVNNKFESVGHWIEAYNNDSNIIVEKLLRKSVDWSDDTGVTFFAKKNIVIKTKWHYFLSYWDGFIAIEDDCPIILPESIDQEALLFRPVGDILKILDT